MQPDTKTTDDWPDVVDSALGDIARHLKQLRTPVGLRLLGLLSMECDECDGCGRSWANCTCDPCEKCGAPITFMGAPGFGCERCADAELEALNADGS